MLHAVIAIGGQPGSAFRDGPQHGRHHRCAAKEACHSHPRRWHAAMLPCHAMRGHLIRDMALLLAATLALGTAANHFPGRRLAWWGAGQQPPRAGVDFQWMDVLSAEDVRQALPGAVFIDSRGLGAYGEARIPGAIHLSYSELGNTLPTELESRMRAADLILLYGDTEDADIEQLMAQELRRRGLAPPYVLAGGMPAWRAAALPVEHDTGAEP